MATVFHLLDPEHDAWRPIPDQPPITLLQLERGLCNWPVTGGFCGAATELRPDNTPKRWCPVHQKRGVTPPPPKTKTKKVKP